MEIPLSRGDLEEGGGGFIRASPDLPGTWKEGVPLHITGLQRTGEITELMLRTFLSHATRTGLLSDPQAALSQ